MSDFLVHLNLAQGVGLVASALVIISFAQKSDKNFKIVITLGTFAFAIHFFMLGAYAGVIVAVLNGVRTLLSMRFHNSTFVLVGFITMYVLSAFFVYERPVDLFPFFSSILATYALFKLSGIPLRVVFLITESSWLAYSLVVKSVGGLITNIFVLSTNAITICRLFRDKRRLQDEQKT